MDGRVLTVDRAGLLGGLIRGVEDRRKLRWYPHGTDSADNPMVCVLRAFTRDGGGMYPGGEDIRDAFVWTSGFSERWFAVEELLTALDNRSGKHGFESPIAVIEED
jgi:hypothetical protein